MHPDTTIPLSPRPLLPPRLLRAALVAACLAVLGGEVRAGGVGDAPLGARLELAKQRLLVFTDTLGRQAGAAYPLASSTNPAGDDFLRDPPADYDGYVLPLTTHGVLHEGATVHAGAGIGSVRLPERGTVTAAYVRLDSRDGRTRQGDEVDLGSNEVFLGYSRQLTEFLSLGVETQVTDGRLRLQDRFMGMDRRTRSRISGIGFDTGLMLALHERFTTGVHGGVTWSRSETDGTVTPPGASAIAIEATGRQRRAQIRGGVGWRLHDQVAIFQDWESIWMSHEEGTTTLGRAYTGLELQPVQDLALRLGGVVDTQPQLGLSTGIGYHGTDNVLFELAYAFNTLPEVRREFGRAHVVSLSVVFLF